MPITKTARKIFNFTVTSTILCTTLTVASQTQTQSVSSYDAVPPTQNQLDYEIPEVSERSGLLQDNTKLSMRSVQLFQIVPDGEKSSMQKVVDAEIQSTLNEFVSTNGGKATFNELRELAANLTLLYRSRGELLTRVFIPAQTITNSEVMLAVLKGTLGKVNVVGNTKVESDVFTGAFESQIGELITRDKAESALLRVQNLLPGTSSIGIFSPGDALGESDITIEVTEEESFAGFAYIDNFGSAFTGELRSGIHAEFYNIFSDREQLTIDVIANEKPEGNDNASSCCVGGFKYQKFSEALDYSYGVEAFRSNYDVGDVGELRIANLGFSGESTKLRVFANIHKTVSRSTTTEYTMGFSSTKAEAFVLSTNDGTDRVTAIDHVGEYDLGYRFSHFANSGTLFYGQLGVVFEAQGGPGAKLPELLGYDEDANLNDDGSISAPPSRTQANIGDSIRFTSDLNAVYRASDAFQLKLRLNGQYSEDVLVPVQQISLAGPTGVRAYPSGAYVSDKGFLASADFIISLSEYASISSFFDIAYGDKNFKAVADAELKANLAGAGLGLEIKYNSIATFKVTAAWALKVSDDDAVLGQGGREATGRDEPQVFASVSVNF